MTKYTKAEPDTIREMFNSIAKHYDKTNAVLSFQMHKKWNKTLVNQVIVPSNPEILLDLCCGTGAIAFEYLKDNPSPQKVFMLDFSEEMLAHAKMQANVLKLSTPITFLQADAQKIPLDDNSVDCATMAYGIRNVKSPLTCIADVFRVLKNEGTFGILELTQPKNKLLKFGHHFYLRNILPFFGKFLTSNKSAYDYLCNSINTFISPQELEHMMLTVGFQEIQRYSLLGGIATIIVGKKKLINPKIN